MELVDNTDLKSVGRLPYRFESDSSHQNKGMNRMPCYDSRDNANLYAQEADSLRSMLCGICGRVPDALINQLINVDPSLRTWWQGHLRQDARKKQEEETNKVRKKIASEAIAKLTVEELEALGIR